jgi:biotin carboxyl carrier protein
VIFDAVVDGRALRVEVTRANGRFAVTLAGRPMEIDFVSTDRHFASLLVAGHSYEVALEPRTGGYAVFLQGDVLEVQLQDASSAARAPAAADTPRGGPARVQAPMPGKIVRVLASVGQEVTNGQGLVVMEAMKMENELRAARAGRVREVRVAEGEAVETGALLVVLE